MIAFGILGQGQALEAIDPNTIALLVGMMAIVNVLKRTGVFRYAGWRTAIALGGDPWRMMIGFALFTAVASALLDLRPAIGLDLDPQADPALEDARLAQQLAPARRHVLRQISPARSVKASVTWTLPVGLPSSVTRTPVSGS